MSTMDDMHNINQSRQEETIYELPSELPVYEHVYSFKSTHRKEIIGVEFYNFLRPSEPIIFATVGSNTVSIYECHQDHIKEVQNYIDANYQEIFFTCSWSYNPYTLDAILAFAGKHGIIKMIYPLSAEAVAPLFGHCGVINELKFHPKDPSILLSASGDRTLRLWNIESGHCIAVFGGVHGHLNMVMSADFDSAGNRIISCGMDHALKIWRLDKSPLKELIIRSFHELSEENRPLRIYKVHVPDYSTIHIHKNHVYCVKWYDNFVLSKSLENEIVLWTPDSHLVHRFGVKHCTFSYMRFTLDSYQKYMAIGNAVGEIYLWALKNKDPTKYTVLKNKKCTQAVRHTAFSEDGKVIICVSDDSTVHRYNKK